MTTLGNRSNPNAKVDVVGRKDLPPTTASDYDNKVREALSTYLGHRGDPQDRGITVRDLADAGIIKVADDYTGGSKNPVGGVGAAILADIVTAQYTQDLRPPPAPTGFTAVANFSTITVGHDGPSYTQGNGHSHTVIYGVTYSSGALPVFTDADRLFQFSGSVFAFPTEPATTWHLWATWVSNDGVESTSPAGGVNGVVVRTGQDIGKVLEALASSIGQSELTKALSKTITDSTNGVNYLATQNGIRVEAASGGKKVVGGFGVMGTAVDNAGPSIDFGVMANRFYVAAPIDPTRPDLPTKVPFVVQAVDIPANGTTPKIDAGVYMDTAFIKYASITQAMIGSVSASSITTGVLQSVINQSGVIFNGVNAATFVTDPTTKVVTATLTQAVPGTTEFGTGYYLGPNQFFVGSPTNYMYWNNTSLTVKGTVVADAGSFGGIIIGNGHIRSIGMNPAKVGTGFYLDKDGNFTLGDTITGKGLTWDQVTQTATFSGTLNIKSATSGSRLEITNDYIKVYDNDVLRVQIGDLTK